MSDTNSCQPCCATPDISNIPGPQGDPGDDGADGTNGLNAFTISTANTTIPAVGNDVLASVADSSWCAIGQEVFFSDGTHIGHFSVASKPDTSSVSLTFLGETGDGSPGDVIATGATLTPSGIPGTDGADGFAVTADIDASVGGSQALDTTTNTQVLGKSLTLAASAGKTYLLFARCRFDYNGATFAANQIINFKIRRTNNTASDVADAVGNLQTQIITTKSYTAGEIAIIGVPYTSAGVSDTIEPMASVDVLPSAGSVDAVECSITAVELT